VEFVTRVIETVGYMIEGYFEYAIRAPLRRAEELLVNLNHIYEDRDHHLSNYIQL